MREARGPEWTDWLHDRGVQALSGVDTRSARPPPARGRRDAGRGRDRRGRRRRRGAARRAGAAGDGRRGARRGRLDGGRRRVYSDSGAIRIAVVDYGCKLSILRRLARAGAAVTVYPHDADADTLAAHDGGAALERSRRSRRRSHAEVAVVRELLGRVPVARHLPRPPAARARDRPLDVQAPVRPPRREPSGARARDRPGARDEPEPRLRRRADGRARRDARVALRRHRRGPRYPDLRARSVQFHPEAGPGPHDAWPILDEWVEEVRRAA